MRISFDLDDTLICNHKEVPREPNRVPFFLKPWINEPLRLGTRVLIKELKQRGHEIWIYTTSYRSPCLVSLWLRCYGIQVAGVINQNIHRAHLRHYSGDSLPSKNPQAFGIDLHVDDSEGVKLEGKKYGFQVVVVSPEDCNWTRAVLEAVARR
ncbi:MAG: hypothetical protein JGK17_03540 [Microcoleus sp. PH2017_10_PVI_O_A]|uniref:hypothetical protein n=1 Tax=unclassified Microcoleus TaxID=2642155 RepID=UPI001DF3CA63|nr:MULTISPECIES: hypothetical protein [unclassified Microcoleus]TAE85579.1 MAG: hypothetical protein EAZ83_02210 [Oscillatoriales cyanobacterium]MCC3404659.1 hypothetical protein [Microcoleus sp. PH2017_10_PVI_O_A]MCC3458685.1 hypothetical protein [Microcoleus sp. PH2017_11_PCY_U_A]MCC3476951.1 hypothetical protein [Microcoleus sp. PH2017_12_PCY_D_A]MCC3558008.1 hypothetical protein [Microcoleus sp. PH2017_27_LUM_O_A]